VDEGGTTRNTCRATLTTTESPLISPQVRTTTTTGKKEEEEEEEKEKRRAK
jgi:hypothetical protein